MCDVRCMCDTGRQIVCFEGARTGARPLAQCRARGAPAAGASGLTVATGGRTGVANEERTEVGRERGGTLMCRSATVPGRACVPCLDVPYLKHVSKSIAHLDYVYE
jgi:hypothetical protein